MAKQERRKPTGRRNSFGGPRREGDDRPRTTKGGKFRSTKPPADGDRGRDSGPRGGFGTKPRRESDGGDRPFRKGPSSGGYGRAGSSYEGGRRVFKSGGPRKRFDNNDESRPPRGEQGEGGEFRGRRREGGDFDSRPRRPRTDSEGRSSGGFRGRRRDSDERPSRYPRGERPERRSFVESKVSRHKERSEKSETPAPEKPKDGLIRLNKFISNSGVCSRREADERIKLGLVTVNGVTVTEMGHKVKPTDDVRYEGKKLTAEKPVYILLNKPKGFITTTDDPEERKTVMSLIASACKERVYPVGRLDRNTTGLLLFTNDGELTDKLTHPSFNAKKIYKVELDRPLTKDDFEKVKDGVHLEEGKAIVDDLAVVSDDGKTVGIELHIGWNHVVRRIFNALNYDVVKLDRVVYAGLDKKDLKRGDWRFLKPEEIVRLKHF